MLNITFDGQKDGEKVIAVFHKSPVAYSKSILSGSLCIVLGIVFGIIANIPELIPLGVILAIMIFVRIWFLWAHNVYLVTNIRVVTVTQDRLFEIKFHESYLASICQVNARINGLLESAFNYGEVMVQTEGELWLKGVENPERVKTAIFKAIEQHKTESKHSQINP